MINNEENQKLEALMKRISLKDCYLQLGELSRIHQQLTPGSTLNYPGYLETHKDKDLFFISGVAKPTGRASDKDIKMKNILFFDFDIRSTEKRNGNECDDERLVEIINEIRKKLDRSEKFKDYYYILFSGNGAHIAYVGTPIEFKHKEDIEHFKLGMRELNKQISEVAEYQSDDNCVNVARIMRLPLSINHKNNKQTYFVAFDEHAKSGLLNNILPTGKNILEKWKKEVEEKQTQMKFSVSSSGSSTYEEINRIPIYDLVRKKFGWEYHGRHFTDPGEKKPKACFVPDGQNFIVHGGTHHFSSEQVGYSPFQFIKMIHGLDDHGTFQWFEENYPHIKELGDNARQEYKEKDKTNPESNIEIVEEKNSNTNFVNKLDLSCIPRGTFLDELLKYQEGVTDAPDEFIIVSGLVLLASIMKNNIWKKHGNQSIRPHLWAVLIAPSSRFRKSTAINIAKQLARDLGGDILFSEEATPEVFIEYLSETPYGLLTINEMGGFLKQMERSYMGGSKELLTDLYDSPSIYRRKRKDKKGKVIEFIIEKPVINILAGSTIDWFLKNVSEGDVASGFLPRFIFVSKNIKEKETIFSPKVPDEERKQSLLFTLNAISENWHGEKEFSFEAEEIYDQYMRFLDKEMISYGNSNIDAFYSRLSISVIKIAMVLEATIRARDIKGFELDNSEKISKEAMQSAISIVDFFKENCRQLVTNELVFTRNEKELKRVKSILLKHNKKMRRRDLLRATGMLNEGFEKLLKTLEESGDIVITDEKEIGGKTFKEVDLL